MFTVFVLNRKHKVVILSPSSVSVPQTVKARSRGGAPSLDLTVPAQVARDQGVQPGDVFALDVTNKGGRLVLTYTRVYGGQ